MHLQQRLKSLSSELVTLRNRLHVAQPAAATTTESNTMAQNTSRTFEHHQQQQHQICSNGNNNTSPSVTTGSSATTTTNHLKSTNNENKPINDNLGLPLPAPRLHHGNVLKPPKLAKPRLIPDLSREEGACALKG